MDSIFVDYLAQISKFEKDTKFMTISEFEELKNEILSHLEQGYRLRFNKLKFIQDVNTDFADDVPF